MGQKEQKPMIDFRKQITKLIEETGTDIAKVSRLADLSYPTLFNFLKGKSDMKTENLQTVLDVLAKLKGSQDE